MKTNLFNYAIELANQIRENKKVVIHCRMGLTEEHQF